ncbi:MAG: PAS domain-containing protein [Candidatus Paceibacterota bacterium]|jgi:two-component system NtrC family sensor kinase
MDKKLTEEQINSIIENSAVATFVIDSGHKVLYWNKACEILTGAVAKDMVGTDNQWKAFYDHQRPCVADLIIDKKPGEMKKLYEVQTDSELVKGGLHAEGWYPNLGGKRKYIIFDAAPIFDKGGNITGAIETLQDVTETKKAEEILREKEERYRSFLQNFPGVAYWGKVGSSSIYFHGAVEKITGYGEKDFSLGKISWDKIIYPEDFGSVAASLENISSLPNHLAEREYRIVRKDGNLRWVHEMIQYFYDNDKPAWMQSTAYDITERKEAEKRCSAMGVKL